MDSIIIFCAKYLIVLPPVIFIWFWVRQSRRVKLELGYTVFLAAVLAGIADKVGGKLFYDTRPFVTQHITPLIKHAADNGFPSEHTLLAATVAVVVGFYNRSLGICLAAIAIIIGAARVAAHVHSPIDIIGSLAMAAVAGWVGKFIVTRWIAKDADGQQ